MDRTIPSWVWVVLVLLAAGSVRAWLPEPVSSEVVAAARALGVERDPRRMNARELRQLPGVGTKLALVLAGARDSHALERPLVWEDVPGIGEVRAREIRAWCRAHGIEPDPFGPGRRSRVAPGYPGGVSALPLPVRLALAVLLAACGETRGSSAPVAPDTTRASPAPAVPAPDGTLREGTAQVRTLALQGGALHGLEAGKEGGVLVLLLHGARYSARTWEELGTLERLARAGHHALAIDWPGYGATPAWGADVDASTLIAGVCDELGAERVVLVAPSLGGRFALEFLRASPARMAGLVAIAPAGAGGFDPETWTTPTLLLWGERDDVVPLDVGRALAERLGGARLEVLAGASHPCYLDQPERFHALLFEFLGTVAPPPPARER